MATGTATTRQSAARLTRASQISALALGGIAAAVLLLGLPGTRSEQAPARLELPTLESLARPQARPQVYTPDLMAVADRFGTIANSPRQPVVADAANPNPGNGVMAPTAPPPPPPDNIKYLGHVGLGSTLFALINENQIQRMVGVEDELSAGKVVEITPEHLTLDRDGTRKVIDRAAKTGPAISSVVPPGAGNTRGIRGGPRGNISPEDIMARSRGGVVPQAVNVSTLDQPQRQAWDDNFTNAMRRMLESGRFKDAGDAKEVAQQYADQMARIAEDERVGMDPQLIEQRRKELDATLQPETPQ